MRDHLLTTSLALDLIVQNVQAALRAENGNVGQS